MCGRVAKSLSLLTQSPNYKMHSGFVIRLSPAPLPLGTNNTVYVAMECANFSH